MKKILLNGEDRSYDVENLIQLINTLQLDPKRIAVEKNGKIVKKDEYTETKIEDNDKIEIVHFVGGG
jgi:thiamine biosynthesis protein ThiS